MIVNPFESSDYDAALVAHRGNVAATAAIINGRVPRSANFSLSDIPVPNISSSTVRRSVLAAAALGVAMAPLHLESASAAEVASVETASLAQPLPTLQNGQQTGIFNALKEVLGFDVTAAGTPEDQEFQISQAAEAAATTSMKTGANDTKAAGPNNEAFLTVGLPSYTTKSTGQSVAKTPVELPSIGSFVKRDIESFKARLHGQIYVSPDMTQPTLPAIGTVSAPNSTDIKNQLMQSTTAAATKERGHATTEKVRGAAKPAKTFGQIKADKVFPVLADPAKISINSQDSKVPQIEVPAQTQVVAPTDSVVVNVQNNKSGNGGAATVILEDLATHQDKSIISGILPGSSTLRDHQTVHGGQVIGRVAAKGLDGGAKTGISYMETPSAIYGVPVTTKPICVVDCADLPIKDAYKGLQQQSDVWRAIYNKAHHTNHHKVEVKHTPAITTPAQPTEVTQTSQNKDDSYLGNIVNKIIGTPDPDVANIPAATVDTTTSTTSGATINSNDSGGIDTQNVTDTKANTFLSAADSTDFLKTKIDSFTTIGTGVAFSGSLQPSDPVAVPDQSVTKTPDVISDIAGIGSGTDHTSDDRFTSKRITKHQKQPDSSLRQTSSSKSDSSNNSVKHLGKIIGLKPGATKTDKALTIAQIWGDDGLPEVEGVATGLIESELGDNVRNGYGFTGNFQTQPSTVGGSVSYASELRKAHDGPTSDIDKNYPLVHSAQAAAEWTKRTMPAGLDPDHLSNHQLEKLAMRAQGVNYNNNPLYDKYDTSFVPRARALLKHAEKIGPSDAVIFDDTSR